MAHRLNTVRIRLKQELLLTWRHHHHSRIPYSLNAKLFSTTSHLTSSAPPSSKPPSKDVEEQTLIAAAAFARQLAAYQLQKEAKAGNIGNGSIEKEQEGLESTLSRVQRELLEEGLRLAGQSREEEMKSRLKDEVQSKALGEEKDEDSRGQEKEKENELPSRRKPKVLGNLNSLLQKKTAKIEQDIKEQQERENAIKSDFAEKLREMGFSEGSIKNQVAFVDTFSWMMAIGIIFLAVWGVKMGLDIVFENKQVGKLEEQQSRRGSEDRKEEGVKEEGRDSA